MALRDFWMNVQTGARLIVPQVIADLPRRDASFVERGLRGATLWLTPRAVEGFQEAEFDFLTDSERKSLASLVEKFRKVAETVNSAERATDKALSKALPLFRDIVRTLDFDRYGDDEAYRLGKLIEREIGDPLPQGLAELRFETGFDHSGDPAIWIWAFLTDEASETDERFLRTAQQLRDVIEHAARVVASERWPYVSFRSLKEQAEPVEVS